MITNRGTNTVHSELLRRAQKDDLDAWRELVQS